MAVCTSIGRSKMMQGEGLFYSDISQTRKLDVYLQAHVYKRPVSPNGWKESSADLLWLAGNGSFSRIWKWKLTPGGGRFWLARSVPAPPPTRAPSTRESVPYWEFHVQGFLGFFVVASFHLFFCVVWDWYVRGVQEFWEILRASDASHKVPPCVVGKVLSKDQISF